MYRFGLDSLPAFVLFRKGVMYRFPAAGMSLAIFLLGGYRTVYGEQLPAEAAMIGRIRYGAVATVKHLSKALSVVVPEEGRRWMLLLLLLTPLLLLLLCVCCCGERKDAEPDLDALFGKSSVHIIRAEDPIQPAPEPEAEIIAFSRKPRKGNPEDSEPETEAPVPVPMVDLEEVAERKKRMERVPGEILCALQALTECPQHKGLEWDTVKGEYICSFCKRVASAGRWKCLVSGCNCRLCPRCRPGPGTLLDPKGHQLDLVTVAGENEPQDRLFTCSRCGSKHRVSSGRWNCAACGYDLCLAHCGPAFAMLAARHPVRCPSGHILSISQRSHAAVCEFCHISIQKDTQSWTCRCGKCWCTACVKPDAEYTECPQHHPLVWTSGKQDATETKCGVCGRVVRYREKRWTCGQCGEGSCYCCVCRECRPLVSLKRASRYFECSCGRTLQWMIRRDNNNKTKSYRCSVCKKDTEQTAGEWECPDRCEAEYHVCPACRPTHAMHEDVAETADYESERARLDKLKKDAEAEEKERKARDQAKKQKEEEERLKLQEEVEEAQKKRQRELEQQQKKEAEEAEKKRLAEEEERKKREAEEAEKKRLAEEEERKKREAEEAKAKPVSGPSSPEKSPTSSGELSPVKSAVLDVVKLTLLKKAIALIVASKQLELVPEYVEHIAETDKNKWKNTHFFFALDCSGSMKGTRWEAVNKGYSHCLKCLEPMEGVLITTFTFDDMTYPHVKSKPPKAALKEFKRGLPFNAKGTNYARAMDWMVRSTEISQKGFSDKLCCIMFLSDGQGGYPQAAIDKLVEAKKRGDRTLFFTIACVTKEGEDAEMIKMAKEVGGAHYKLSNQEASVAVFVQILGV